MRTRRVVAERADSCSRRGSDSGVVVGEKGGLLDVVVEDADTPPTTEHSGLEDAPTCRTGRCLSMVRGFCSFSMFFRATEMRVPFFHEVLE